MKTQALLAVLMKIRCIRVRVLLGSLAITAQKILMNVIPILVKMEQFAQTSYMDQLSVLAMLDGLVNYAR
jgi:hypothetical protein